LTLVCRGIRICARVRWRTWGGLRGRPAEQCLPQRAGGPGLPRRLRRGRRASPQQASLSLSPASALLAAEKPAAHVLPRRIRHVQRSRSVFGLQPRGRHRAICHGIEPVRPVECTSMLHRWTTGSCTPNSGQTISGYMNFHNPYATSTFGTNGTSPSRRSPPSATNRRPTRSFPAGLSAGFLRRNFKASMTRPGMPRWSSN